MTRTYTLILAPGVLVETLGESVAVWAPGSKQVQVLEGDSALLMSEIHRYGHARVPSSSAVHDLLGSHLVVSSISRRIVLTAGTGALGAGIATLALPSVATASSLPGGGDSASGVWSITNVRTFDSPVPPTPDKRTFSIAVVNSLGLTIADGTFGTVSVSSPIFVFTVQWSASAGVFQPTVPPLDDERFPADFNLATGWYDRESTLRFNPGGGNVSLTFTPVPPPL